MENKINLYIKYKDKYLNSYTKKFGRKKYKTLDNAIKDANTSNNVGGITKSKKGYTIRKGTKLIFSPYGDVSWLKKNK